nr:hypothetical protein [Tanacetum cinerariifolium]
MVACLEKTAENIEFHQIVDFLSTCSVNYALTVSPTIYASYIEQLWNTAISKIVTSVKQIHAIVDGKVVVISQSPVRSDLLFNDEDGYIVRSGEDKMEQETDLMDFVPPTPHDSPLSGGHILESDKDLIAKRKRFFAAQRVEQFRNKPPTKAQLKNKMETYLKHMGKYIHNQLKSKIFKEIQMLYEREHKWINDFVPMDSKEKLKEDDAEKEELRACLDIVPVDDIA